jgi:short-subunit dehydrogenase
MKTKTFENKICWITGASSGIGAALAQTLSSMGAFLILSARDQQRLEMIKMQCANSEKIHILLLDMEAKTALPSVANKAWDLFQGIDYVFLNAGMAVRDMIIDTDLAMIEKVMNVNFLGNVVLTKELLPLMQKRGNGCFVVTSSLCGKFGVPKLGAYSASKHALHGFYESLRAENERYGIRVTMITAGLVRTNITLRALKGDGSLYGKMQESVGAGISPETCAYKILKAVAKGKCEALVGSLEKYSVWFKRFFPGLLRIAITRHPMHRLRKAGFLKSNPYDKPKATFC